MIAIFSTIFFAQDARAAEHGGAIQEGSRQPCAHRGLRHLRRQPDAAHQVHPDQRRRHVHREERWQHGPSQFLGI